MLASNYVDASSEGFKPLKAVEFLFARDNTKCAIDIEGLQIQSLRDL